MFPQAWSVSTPGRWRWISILKRNQPPPDDISHERRAEVEKREASAAWNWHGFPTASQFPSFFKSLNIHLPAHQIPNSSVKDVCTLWSSSDSPRTGKLERREATRGEKSRWMESWKKVMRGRMEGCEEKRQEVCLCLTRRLELDFYFRLFPGNT